MATELDQPAHNARWLVEFNWDSTLYLRVTDHEEDVGHLSLGTFSALPTLEVELPTNTGGFDENPLRLKMLRDSNSLFQDLSSGEPHAPVDVKVYEECYEPGASTYSTFLHFWGRISKARRNYQNRAEQLLLEAESVKSRMDVPMGLPCNPQCAWALGDNNCQVSAFAVATGLAGTVSASASGNELTITGLPAAPSGEDTYWQRGYIEKDGLKLSIRRWNNANSTTFYTRIRAPAAWVGQSVTVFAGCDKTVETCRSRWSNEEYFGGFGFAIPDYHPVYEQP